MPLNITRHRGEKTVITMPPSGRATKIVIDVTRLRPGEVRLSFEAPEPVVIDREEIHAEKLARGRRASATLMPGERRYTIADAIRAQEAALKR